MVDRIEQLQAELARGVAELVNRDDWQRWLQLAARLPKYSFQNTVLIDT